MCREEVCSRIITKKNINMKRSILVLFWVFVSATMFAQGGIDVAGIVLDEQGQELIGVSVQIYGKLGVGGVSDFD